MGPGRRHGVLPPLSRRLSYCRGGPELGRRRKGRRVRRLQNCLRRHTHRQPDVFVHRALEWGRAGRYSHHSERFVDAWLWSCWRGIRQRVRRGVGRSEWRAVPRSVPTGRRNDRRTGSRPGRTRALHGRPLSHRPHGRKWLHDMGGARCARSVGVRPYRGR